MSTGNDALAALDAQTTELEKRMADYDAANQQLIKDAVADITQLLGNIVIKPSDLQAITARLKALSDNAAALTATTQAADATIQADTNPAPPATPAPASAPAPADTATGGQSPA